MCEKMHNNNLYKQNNLSSRNAPYFCRFNQLIVKKSKESPKEQPTPTHALAITKSRGAPLSKEQQTFNRLINRIETLRLEGQKISKNLDDQLDYYGRVIYPMQAKMIDFRKEIVRLSFPFLQTKKGISKSEKGILQEFIVAQIDEIRFFEETTDPEFEEMFRNLTGFSFDEADDIDLEETKSGLEGLFGDMGVDFDLNDFENNMHTADAESGNNTQDQFNWSTGFTKKTAHSKKSKKQLQQEEKERLLEEAKSKNISSIFKQLAKLFHPDLEQDNDRKPEKEALMKQLTAAYDNNDLLTLLKLELEWIYKEDSEKTRPSGDKLKLYNEVLKEQVFELEREIALIQMHPRYTPIIPREAFGAQTINLKKEKTHLENLLYSIELSVRQLKGEKALHELKSMLYIFGLQRKEKDFDSLDLPF